MSRKCPRCGEYDAPHNPCSCLELTNEEIDAGSLRFLVELRGLAWVLVQLTLDAELRGANACRGAGRAGLVAWGHAYTKLFPLTEDPTILALAPKK